MNTVKWNSKIMFPQDNYVARVTNVVFGPSKGSGNPMITLDLEVVSPDVVQVGDKNVTVAGVGLKHYITTQVMDGENINAEKTAACASRIQELYEKLGLDFSTFNAENPDTSVFENMKIWVLLKSDRSEKRKAPTAEQAARKELGEIIKDPITGKDLVQYFPKIDEIFGIAS